MSGRRRGDCFEAAANFVLDRTAAAARPWEEEGLVLVHGNVTGFRGEVAGRRFSHAWVEAAGGALVIDPSNGDLVAMERDAYYDLGRIDPEETFRYDPEETRDRLLRSGHYGPWDLEPAEKEWLEPEE